MKYHVTYYYLATGMEGIADTDDYGMVEADSEREAKQKAIEQKFPDMSESNKSWAMGCLTATLIS